MRIQWPSNRTISAVRWKASLPCLAVALAAPIAAQVPIAPNDMPPEVRAWRMGGTVRVVDFPDPPRPDAAPAPDAVSADVLRHPLSSKARRMLKKAQQAAESGDHAEAIQQLRETLAKDPASAAYVQPWLGVEYLRTDQFAKAVTSLEQAVLLMPHSSENHSNLAVSLASIGDYGHAQKELQRALELDRGNTKAKQLSELLRAQAPDKTEPRP
jgi:tetratricopeptide (TPR) repeat protein